MEMKKEPEVETNVDLKMNQYQKKEPLQQVNQATVQDRVSVTCERVLIDENAIDENGKNVDDHQSKDCQQMHKSVFFDEIEIDVNDA